MTDLAVAGAPVRRVEVASATLDDVFLELTGRSLRETNEQSTDESEGRGSMTATITQPTRDPVIIRTREVSLPKAPGVLADTWNVMVRELRPVFREPASVLFAMVQPLVFLGLFAPLLPEVENGSALQWFVPGIIAMTALMGASFTGANLTQEIVTGSHERLLVSPLSRSSLLVGRALKEIVPMLMQAAIIVVVVTPFSFDLHLAHVLVGVVVLAGFSIGVGALSFALALVSKDQEWLFWTVQQTLIFPVLLLAGVLLPLDGAPGWLRAASHLNPLNYVVEAERALFAGTFPVDTVALRRPRLRDRRGVRPVGRPPGDARVQLTADPGLRAPGRSTRKSTGQRASGPLGCGRDRGAARAARGPGGPGDRRGAVRADRGAVPEARPAGRLRRPDPAGRRGAGLGRPGTAPDPVGAARLAGGDGGRASP